MQTLVAEILAAWKRAEQLEKQLPPGSPEHAAIERADAALRDIYQDLLATQVGDDAYQLKVEKDPG